MIRVARYAAIPFAAPVCLLASAPVLASDENADEADRSEGAEIAAAAQPPQQPGVRPPAAQTRGPAGAQEGFGPPDIVFDDTWVSVGIGAGLVPSYSGSNDYRVFPLPLIVGRVGGVGISPNGPGFNLDLLSQPPARGAPETSFSFGPSVRFRNDRDGQIGDAIVAAAGELDTALEVGVNGGVTFPGVLDRFDRLSLSSSVRWDVLGAHDGMLIEPGIGYFTPVNNDIAIQLSLSAQFVDDDFADYYYSVSPAQSAASGLPLFQADGGLNSLGVTTITTIDLSGNLLDGGWNLYAIAGYSRLVGDAADTPYTDLRGSADQFIGGIGVGYTF
ncbi:MipA/OmpV family protein [Erythrobacter sp. MTPC3]|uniref:MipA/OmpV family protein n=1 Tax=Erythrobacter sp. MTPC3 TaxID=3056564 RepID=UPI0036F1D40A